MSKTKYYKNILLILIFSIIISLFMGFIINRLVAYENYKNTSLFIRNILSENPNLEKEIFTALKSTFDNSSKSERDILEKYGYNFKTFSSLTNKKIILVSSLSVFIFCFVFLLVIAHQRKRNISRINSLSGYVYKINVDGKGELFFSGEDDFSILEDEIYKTVTELKTTKESALKERNALADNLADISHQLKTPIAAMSLMVQLIVSESDENKIYIDKIKFQLDRMEYLISALLKLSKLDSGIIDFEKNDINVYSLICQVTEQIEPIASAKNQEICFDENLDINILGDRNWIAEAISKILKNSCEHTPNDGKIEILYQDNPLYVEIIISDNGNGFNKEDLPHLFKRAVSETKKVRNTAYFNVLKNIITS